MPELEGRGGLIAPVEDILRNTSARYTYSCPKGSGIGGCVDCAFSWYNESGTRWENYLTLGLWS